MNVKFGSILIILMTLVGPSLLWRQEESRGARLLYKRVRDVVFRLIGPTEGGRELQTAQRINKLQPMLAPDAAFPCDVTHARSPTRPKSVHQLRPGDIDVVGALGDSLTAANGAVASNLLQVLTENRGVSAWAGGRGTWRQFLTLPNILKEFNPNLIGYSLGDSLGHHRWSQFNAAEPASMSQDLPFMVKELVKRIKNDKRVNFNKDWKMINLFIGSNDFCLNFCYLTPREFRNSAETHRHELMYTLDYLRDNLPRTLVNLVLAPNLKVLRDLRGLPPVCDYLHLVTCPCLFGIARENTAQSNIRMQDAWRQVQREVAADPRYRYKSDFAVVLQPFADALEFPEVRPGIADKSYLSADCFHLSQKGHARVANALWNNMLEPVGNKSGGWYDPFVRFLCPTEKHPFLYTHANSYKS